MTTLNDIRNPHSPVTAARKGRAIMWWIAGIVGAFAVAVWIGFFVAAKMGGLTSRRRSRWQRWARCRWKAPYGASPPPSA